jgi:integrase
MKRKPPLKWVQAFGGYYYFRRPGFPRTRLPGPPLSPAFMAAYQAAMASPLALGASRSKAGSVAAATAAYIVSPEFSALAPGTRNARRAILQRFRNDHGELPIGQMPPKFIALMISKLKPHAARNYFKAVRALCQFCVANEMITSDPTQNLKLPKVKSDGHHTWTPDEIAAFEAHHLIGTKARLAFALGLYTADRRGDVIRIGRQHIRDGVLTMRQEKTGALLVVPVHPDLQTIIDATPIGHLTLLTTKDGKAYGATGFSKQFRAWCDAAELPKRCVFHGLRKTLLTRLADAGCTAHEIAAISGHKSLREIERYTRQADQRRLARAALGRIRTTAEQELSKLPTFDNSVADPSKKTGS